MWIVDRVIADLVGDALDARIVFREEPIFGEHLEGIGRRGPEDVRAITGAQFAHIGNARRGGFVEDFHFDARIALLKRLLIRGGQFLGKGGDDGDGLLRPCSHGQCREQAQK